MAIICSKCGFTVSDSDRFCTNCGAELPSGAQAGSVSPVEYQAPPQGYVPPAGQGVPPPQGYMPPAGQGTPPPQSYVPPQGYVPPAGPSVPPPGYPPMPPAPGYPVYHMGPGGNMKWFKFVIYFQLFAAMLVNLANGLQYLTGLAYEGQADAIYAMFPGLSVLDKLMGVFGFAMIGLAIYARIRLAAFRANGPTVYLVYLGLVVGVEFLYVVIGSILISSWGTTLFNSQTASVLISGIILLICNIIYFSRRKVLFVY